MMLYFSQTECMLCREQFILLVRDNEIHAVSSLSDSLMSARYCVSSHDSHDEAISILQKIQTAKGDYLTI